MNNQAIEQNNTAFNPFSGPEIERVIHTTESQLEIWTDCLIGGNDANKAYNLSVSIKLKGDLHLNALQHAVNTLVERHECLRACFSTDGRFMSIFSALKIDISPIDVSHVTATEKEITQNEIVKEEVNFLFDLVNGPLFKVRLIKFDDFEHVLVLTHHHIIGDGLSIDIMVEELGLIYSAHVQNKVADLPTPERFSDYAEKVNSLFDSDDNNHLEAYWLNMYKDSVPTVELPLDYVRPKLRTYKSERLDFPLDDAIIEALKKLGIGAGCSLVTTMLSAFEVFLSQTTGQNDLVVGFPSSGNAAYGMRQLIGDCVNLLPLRSHINTQISFLDYLKQRNSQLFDAYEHQQVSFGHILQKLAIPRDPSRIPMVPVILTIDLNKDIESEFSFAGLTHEFEINPRDYVTFELQLHAFRSKNGPSFQWSYNTTLFKPETITHMMNAFEAVINKIISNPNNPISEIINSDFLSVYHTLNDTQAVYPTETLHVLLRNQAKLVSNNIAIAFKDTNISYQELQKNTNQLANYFVNQGIKSGDFIAVAMSRGPELVSTLLAILQCGAAYLPLDPTYPLSRLEFMLEDSKAKYLITNKNLSDTLPKSTKHIILENLLPDLDTFPTTPLPIKVDQKSTAYIMYTSGSTGKPKGVSVSHKNFVNFLSSMAIEPGINASDRLLSITTISFDIAGLELFLPLLVGATLVITDDNTAKDGRLLNDLLVKEHISILQATPTTWQMLLDTGLNTRLPIKALCGGEALPLPLATELVSKCDSLWNMYGPTETTVWSAVKQIKKSDQLISIGKPIANTQIYLLDEQGALVPPGSVGEITIAGDGVAIGYWNRLELTSEKFIPDPFRTDANSMMYKTGDLGKLLPNGELECLGRIDQQVKIRGHRIELGEIEQALMQLDGIQTAVVLAESDSLVAFVVPNKHLSIEAANNKIATWKDALKHELPPHLVPNTFNVLDILPTTLNGKIDRKALLTPVVPQNKAMEFTPPRTKAEKIIADIWQDCLELDQIDIFSNFFELGGHSLIAVKVMALLEAQTGKRLPLASLLEFPTIEKLALLLDMDNRFITWDSLVPIKRGGTKTPLYIVHGAGMNVLIFNALAKNLDDDQPVYALQAKGLNGIDEPHDTVEAMATHYVDAITKANPKGPYALAGYSFGGIIAYEMARQLSAQNKKVTMLAMLDTYVHPGYYYASPWRKKLASLNYRLKNILFVLKEMLSSWEHTKERINIRKEKLLNLYSRLKYGKKVQHQKTYQQPYLLDKMNAIAISKYHIVPQPFKIDLFRVDDDMYYMHDPIHLGWKELALKGLDIHSIPGDHVQLFTPPNDKKSALILQDLLNERNSVI